MDPTSVSGTPLTQRETVRIPAGVLGYRQAGTGQPVVLLHGLVANGLVWRQVAAHLPSDLRCIAPDVPLGSHHPALPGADLTLRGQARIVIDLLDALQLQQVVLVGNGYGGDIAQVVAAEHPERVAALVLVATNAFDSDPWPTKALGLLASLPGAAAVQRIALRSRIVQRLPITYGWATKRPIPADIMTAYLAPLQHDPAVVRDFRRFLRGLSPGYLSEASPKLANYDRPALIVWPVQDRVFPADGARRLAALMPQARLVTVEDSYSWVPEDQPRVLAELILGFLREHGLTESPAG